MSSSVLCINVGSSSVKLASFETQPELHEIARGSFSTNELSEAALVGFAKSPTVVVHRFVHGGPNHFGPAVINETLIRDLEAVAGLAPLHMTAALSTLNLARSAFPDARQVACFDTAFHHNLPEVAARYALPSNAIGTAVRRYGFHGLSCEHVVTTLDPKLAKRCVIAHLGSGCSVTAVRNGQSVDTSMGFTPIGGVIMATRPGDLDPGLILYLLRQGHSHGEIEEMLTREAGLHALAGEHAMASILARDDADARFAVDFFCYRIAHYVGAYGVMLGGLDSLVFTGGIGENSADIRTRIVSAVNALQPFETVVVAANEELVMAHHGLRVAV